jgi:hypothetical protein
MRLPLLRSTTHCTIPILSLYMTLARHTAVV